MKDNMIYYSVGALLYTPANNETIFNTLINQKINAKYSLAFCLEDTIKDEQVENAEITMIETFKKLYTYKNEIDMPLIFVRVREHEQIEKIFDMLGEYKGILSGFIIPKFSTENADDYINAISKINEKSDKKIYVMPIYESKTFINIKERADILYTLKQKLSKIEKYVLNIRVGGNDLCHIFGFRRNSYQSIHNIAAISSIFSDIISVYATDYVVSGPVWEYYSGDNWQEGLEKEIQDDLLCGFIGKTAIHPNQIPVINECLKVSSQDYEDAKSILNWDKENLVSSSNKKERMNEYNTHHIWANKIIMLADIYGVK